MGKTFKSGFNRAAPDYLSAVLIILLELLFFRNVIGNDALFGGSGDGRLTMLLTEHWFRFFSGKEGFADLAMFYPNKNVAGYTDMFLGYGIIHSILRFLSFDVYLSYKMTLIALHAFGSFCMYYLLRRKLGTGVLWALFGVIAFSYSTTFARSAAVHTQLFGMSLLPFLAVQLVDVLQGFGNRKRRNKGIYLFIVFFILIMYTSWYIAFFTALFLLILLVTYLVMAETGPKAVWHDIRALTAALGFDLFKCVFLGIVLLVPFILIYLPVMRNSGGYNWGEAFSLSPEFADILNVGDSNLLLGRLIRRLHMDGRGELEEGMSVVLFVAYLLALRFFLKKGHEERGRGPAFFSVLAVSCVVGLVLPMRMSGMGLSFWRYLVWKLIPGGKSIRAVARFLFFLSFPISVVASVYGGQKLKLSGRPRLAAALSTALLPLLLLTQIRRGGVYSSWNAGTQRAFVASVQEAPSSCTAFYVTNSSNRMRSAELDQLDAFEIASLIDIPTLNGYSGGMPEGWGKLWVIAGEDYLPAAAYISLMQGLDNVWGLDLATGSWSRMPPASELMRKERSWKFNGTHIVWEGYESGGKRYLNPQGMSEGPYWTVFPGNYKVTIKGENLSGMEIAVRSEAGKISYPFTSEISEGQVEIRFSVQEVVPDLEVFIRNVSDQQMCFSSFVLVTED
ncbi:MAG: hypothetical protein J6Y13_06780 [Treponema sp.]|nr:hypothetical protein [Treponema sp.]